jgi:phosphoenolpyruvate-protein phosphotransferase (PTS system enzyme I)
MRTLRGLGVSPGIAIGRAVCIETRVVEVYRYPLAPEEIGSEVERFRAATRHTQEEIRRIREKVRRKLGDELAAVFEAHALFLDDPTFLERIVERIRSEHVNAEWAVHRTAEEMGKQFAAIEDSYLRERREDLTDVARQLLRSLQGISHHDLSEIEGEVVIVADELTPSDALRLGREQVMGFAIESGGRTSHTTIIARSLNLPAITGLEGVGELVTDEDPLILDGDSGKVILHPTPRVIEEYRQRQRALAAGERALLATRSLPACTEDGVAVALMANIDLPEEIDAARRFGAAGIGLYRSEFLFIEKSPELPSEEEHLALYRRLAEAAAPHPAIIRTYDLGGRKLSRELLDTREENPVLGLRGVRLTLARPDIFRTQLRALFRAGLYGDVWVMVPMVSTVEEVRQFRAFAADVVRELEREGVDFRRDLKIGVMIEVPSAAMIADRLAAEVDFFSIGTNDLIQYALAVDRNNEHVAHLYQPAHPALLRMLRFVAESARAAGIAVSVCGEMAADPRYAALLLGLGLRRLSVNPRAVPKIKTRLRQLSAAGLEALAADCLELATAEEVERHLDRFLAGVAAAAVG